MSVATMDQYKTSDIQELLRNSRDSSSQNMARFFKVKPGEYAEFDQFLGITTTTLRNIARKFADLPLKTATVLLKSKFNEERLFALIILVQLYQKAEPAQKEEIYQLYLQNIEHVNNWNLVDNSAHHIVGAHLWDKDRQILLRLAKSENLWQRRIAIVATWYFIKRQDFTYTIEIVLMLMSDKQDLIHKASGWMLREVGKQDFSALIDFLDQYSSRMPRTMLRYSIEKLPQNLRMKYLNRT